MIEKEWEGKREERENELQELQGGFLSISASFCPISTTLPAVQTPLKPNKAWTQSLTHTRRNTHRVMVWDGWKGGYFHRAFKNDLQTPWPHSAKSPETLMETIWGFSVIWQTAYLAPASPFSTHFEWNGQIEFEAARKDLFSSVVCVCVRMCVRVFTAGGGLLCRCSLVSRQF